MTVTGHSRNTPDQTPDATEHRLVVAPHPPSGQFVTPVGHVERVGEAIVTITTYRRGDWSGLTIDIDNRQGGTETYGWCQTYVTEAGRQLHAVQSPAAAKPGARVADLNIFETTDPGTAHCAGGSYEGDAFVEWTVAMPEINVTAPATSVS